MIVLILASIFSALLALVIVPVFARVAAKIGLVDHPDDKRKLHTDSIPMVGGISIYLVMLLIVPVAILAGTTYPTLVSDVGNRLFGWLPIDFQRHSIRFSDTSSDFRESMGLLIGCTILLVVGMLDDRFGLRGRQKLLGQFVAATALIVFGYHEHFDKVFGFDIQYNAIAAVFVYFWVIGAINSVNLLDGADGIASTIGIIMSLSLAMMAVYMDAMVTAIIAVTMAGALLGFLRFNFPPAKAYLGDTGSMLIGFVLSALAISCTVKRNSAFAFFAPIAILAIPFLDTGAAIIRRRLTGRSIFTVDRGHLHHALMKRGYSPRVSLLWVALLCTTTAVGGVLSLVYQQSAFALFSILLVVIVMIQFKLFGVAEYQLISRKASSVIMSFFRLTTRKPTAVQQSSVHVQGSRDWQAFWEQLCHFADSEALIELTMDLNAPWLHESFHATRRRSDVPRGDNHEWYTQLPLIADGRLFGRIEIIGPGMQNDSHRSILQNVLAIISEIEDSMGKASRESVYKLVKQEEDPVADTSVPQPASEKNSRTDRDDEDKSRLDADSDFSGSLPAKRD